MNTLTYKGFIGSVNFSEEEGITPQKPYTGDLRVRINPETHSKLALLAKKSGVSLNTYIKQTLERQVAMML